MPLRTPVTIALLLGLALLAFFFLRGQAPSFSNLAEARTYWRDELTHEDAKNVYEKFKQENEKAPASAQHVSAHLIGELIYEREGVAGIAACDSSFGFGCYHGFFGRAISEGGDARVAELDAACVAAFGPLGTGCQHGIGHGILEYVGYPRVNDALTLCGKTTEASTLLGCASGVFMEYNSPLVGDAGALVPGSRAVTAETLYEPCDTVPKKYESVCYYQLGQWLFPQYKDRLSELSAICAELSGDDRARCFEGAGESLSFFAQYDLEKAEGMCAALGQGDDEVSCRAGVSWAMYADPAHRTQAAPACEYADAQAVARCRALADLTQGKGDYTMNQ